MVDDDKIRGEPIGRAQIIQSLIHDINNNVTALADQMVMRREVGIKSGPVMTHIHFFNEPGFLKHA